MTETSGDERRDYYRIKDTVGITYSPCLKDEDIPDEETFAAEIPNDFQLINHLSHIDMESSTLLHSIQDVSPDICRYLKIINTKIEALARHVVTVGLTDEISSEKVILSAGGISLVTNQAFKLESVLRMRMILYPSCSGILAYGKVVRCDRLKDSDTEQFDTAVEYTLIHESDRDALVRHVLQLQSNYLRQKN